MKYLKYIFFIIILYFLSCSYEKKPINELIPLVKVLLFEGIEISINPVNNYIISYSSNNYFSNGNINIYLSNNYIILNGRLLDVDYIEINPDKYFEFLGKKYRGKAIIYRKSKTISLINLIDIESYLYGVLPNEVYPSWHIEALKAQAIVSRTFALYEMGLSKKKNRYFDLYDNTFSQVYNGIDCENPNTTLAVNSTIGEVITYGGKVIQSFFHSSSGGITENSEDVFNIKKDYLRSVNSPFNNENINDKWEIIIKKEEYQEIFKKITTNDIIDIKIEDRTESKRIKTIKIIDSKTNIFITNGVEFRKLIGNSRMKSTKANIICTNDTLIINGNGYGHGVGFGQWDALGMAKKGYNYKSIISYFYKNVSIEKFW